MIKKIIGVLLAIAASIAFYFYMQLYTQNSTTTATKGILFQKTLNLSEYKNVATGNGLLGNFARYSRSDRHNEVITVYCNTFCKK